MRSEPSSSPAALLSSKVYRKGLIHAKMGDNAGARAAAMKSLELAAKAGGSLGEEYTALNNALLARLK